MSKDDLPDDLNHPVLRLMDASTKATVQHATKLDSVERAADRSAAALEALVAEQRRKNDLEERNLDLEERRLGLQSEQLSHRWSSYSAAASGAMTTVKSTMSHPIVTLPIGALAYGLTKVISGYFGVPLEALP